MVQPGILRPQGGQEVRSPGNGLHGAQQVREASNAPLSFYTRDPPEAKLFCKLDAVHGYFQLALDKRSSKFTTFLIQQGRFRYLLAPMGLNASSDWCRQSVIIWGLPYAMKIIDDTIIWAKDEKELEDRVKTVLRRCEENHITISRKKLEHRDSIHFAGHIISDGGIHPDDEKFAALRNFQQPGNVKNYGRSWAWWHSSAPLPRTRHA